MFVVTYNALFKITNEILEFLAANKYLITINSKYKLEYSSN